MAKKMAEFFKEGEVYHITTNPKDKALFNAILKSWVDKLFDKLDPRYKQGILNNKITIDDIIEDFYDYLDWCYMVDDDSKIVPLLKKNLIDKITKLRQTRG